MKANKIKNLMIPKIQAKKYQNVKKIIIKIKFLIFKIIANKHKKN